MMPKDQIEIYEPKRPTPQEMIIAGNLLAIKSSTDKVKNSVDQIAPSIGMILERIPKDGERGGKFIGTFKTKSDLPTIDGVNVKQGDFCYVEDSGDLWYA